MTRILFVVGLLFVSFLYTNAQNIELSGQIIDKQTKEAVPYVHIINLSTDQGTVSNTEGRFWVTMDLYDTLQFSAIGFEKYAFTLKPDIDTDKLDVSIELNTSTLELETVNVFAYRNEQALKRALIEMDAPIEKEEKFTIPGIQMGQKRTTSSGGGIAIGGPLTMIGRVFSKEVKEQKRLKEYKKDYDYQKILTSKYNESVVIEITNLPEDKVEDFMEFCVLEDSFIYRASEYELAVVLNKCLVDFESLLKEDREEN
ncbi:carboxypeptidase-like regulatory domain-containing protein [Fulvivirga sp. RKSG066]|uniref:carboxypeptidase-like regulatory domain-containing protein n=1 Tax=Fulvivirga aurantia TaxID=2529383 RepID=UPI0012BC1747|nr:carboxypeptidase-like regulatory domain-containing protein [Fulvivirga aurantia]MTI22826.1 carboxypeptidase-like regulatory domain-containing protein [Fulvivirga aurantia]